MDNLLPKDYDDIVAEISDLIYVYNSYSAPVMNDNSHKMFTSRKCFIELGSNIRELQDTLSGIYTELINRPNIKMQDELKDRANELRFKIRVVKESIPIFPSDPHSNNTQNDAVKIEKEHFNLLQRIQYLKTYPEMVDGNVDIDDELEIGISKLNMVFNKLNKIYGRDIYQHINL